MCNCVTHNSPARASLESHNLPRARTRTLRQDVSTPSCSNRDEVVGFATCNESSARGRTGKRWHSNRRSTETFSAKHCVLLSTSETRTRKHMMRTSRSCGGEFHATRGHVRTRGPLSPSETKRPAGDGSGRRDRDQKGRQGGGRSRGRGDEGRHNRREAHIVKGKCSDWPFILQHARLNGMTAS